jgi:hypothetical protein
MGVRIRYVGGKRATGYGGKRAVALPVVSFWLLAPTNTLQGTFAPKYSVRVTAARLSTSSDNKIPRVGKSGRELMNIQFSISTFQWVGRPSTGFLA